MAALTFFGVTGTFSAALKDSVYDVDTDPELAPMSGSVTFTPLIDSGNSVPAVTLTPASNLFLVPIKAAIRSGVITSNGAPGVKLVANTAVLGLTGSLYYEVDFGDGLTAGGKTYSVRPFTFQAPTTATTVDLVEVTPAVGQPATGPVPSSAVLSVAGRTGNVVITPADVAGMEDVAHKNAANGYAGLDGSGKLNTAQLPISAMEYKGNWNASTNSPTLADGAGSAGDVYKVATGAARNLGSGSITFTAGDYVIYNGTTWELNDTTDAVSSVAGLAGAVGASALTDALTDGSVNKVLTAADKTRLANTSGTNTGDQNLSAYATTSAVAAGYQPLDSDLTAFAAKTAPSGAVVGTSDAQTLTSKTLTDPKIAHINDANGNRVFDMPAAGGAVNYFEFDNTATGITPTIYAWGADTDIDLNLDTKGAGVVKAKSVPVVTTTGTQTLTNKTLTNPTLTNYTESVVAIGNTGTSKTLSLTSGTMQTATLTGNCTFTMPTAVAGKSFSLALVTGAGGFTATFTGVKWAAATAPTVTVAASKTDVFTFSCFDGSSWIGSVMQAVA